jgi:hypothetical protein
LVFSKAAQSPIFSRRHHQRNLWRSSAELLAAILGYLQRLATLVAFSADVVSSFVGFPGMMRFESWCSIM